LHDAEILIEKTLYLESLEILNKAKDIAIKFEKHPLLLEIFNYIYRVNLFIKKDKNDFGIWQNDYDKLQLMALYHQEKLITTKKYLMEIRFLCSSHITQKNNVKKKLLAILDRLYEIKKDSDSCISVTMNVYAGLNIIYFYLGEVNKAFETNLQYIEFIESKPDSIEILGKQNLIACFNNTLIYALILKKYNQFTIILEKLYAIESNSIKEKDMIFRTASLVETAYYIRTLQIEKGMKYLKQTEEEIIERPEKHDKSYLIAFYDNISILYFLSGNFSKSLFWSNKIINDEGNMRGEIKNLHWLLNLAIHYEMGNVDHIEYAIKLAERSMKEEEENSFSFAIDILNFFKKAPFFTNGKDELKELRILKEKIDTALLDSREMSANELFNFSIWVESKIKKQKYIDIVKKK